MEKNKSKNWLWEAGMLVVTTVLTGGCSYLYGNTLYETIRILILTVMMMGVLVFTLEYSRVQDMFLFDNGKNLWRFMLLYGIFLAGSLLFPMLPPGGWPYLAVFVGLMLFSNRLSGICAGYRRVPFILCQRYGGCSVIFLSE